MRRTLLVLVMAASGCNPEEIEHSEMSEAEATFPTRLAEAYCTTLFACDPVNACAGYEFAYASEAECIEGERTALEEASAAARDGGLVYDDACVERHIAELAELGCDGDTRVHVRFGESFSAVDCQPYYGTVPKDEDPCFDVIGTELSDCEQGSVCGDNQTCRAVDETRCECDEGLTCPYASADDACQPILALGETCVTEDSVVPLGVCELDTYCDFEYVEDGVVSGPRVCAASGDLGTACDWAGECSSWHCGATCEPAPPYLCWSHRAPRRWR